MNQLTVSVISVVMLVINISSFAASSDLLIDKYQASCKKYSALLKKRRLTGGVFMPKLEKKIKAAEAEKNSLANQLCVQLIAERKSVAKAAPEKALAASKPVIINKVTAPEKDITMTGEKTPGQNAVSLDELDNTLSAAYFIMPKNEYKSRSRDYKLNLNPELIDKFLNKKIKITSVILPSDPSLISNSSTRPGWLMEHHILDIIFDEKPSFSSSMFTMSRSSKSHSSDQYNPIYATVSGVLKKGQYSRYELLNAKIEKYKALPKRGMALNIPKDIRFNKKYKNISGYPDLGNPEFMIISNSQNSKRTKVFLDTSYLDNYLLLAYSLYQYLRGIDKDMQIHVRAIPSDSSGVFTKGIITGWRRMDCNYGLQRPMGGNSSTTFSFRRPEKTNHFQTKFGH